MHPKKRTKITDSSGWTHIVYGPSNNVNPKQVSSQIGDPQTLDSMPLDQVLDSHARYLSSWKSSECWKNLADFIQNTIVQRKYLRITNCVCLGLGSISAGRSSAKHELAALITILCLLSKTHCVGNVIFQDPAFNEVDKAFLSKLGYSVVPTPIGFNSINSDTFCFAPHLENEIFALALRDVHPALCIGNSEVLKDQRLHSSARISESALEVFRRFFEASNSREMPGYDQDPWCQFTNIYWRREDTE